MKNKGTEFTKKFVETTMHVILLLLGIVLIFIGIFLNGNWESVLLSVGTSIVATSIVYLSLSSILGDPLSSIMEKLKDSVEILERASKTGLISIWKQRADLSNDAWIEKVKSAQANLDFLGYAMAFLPEYPEFAEILRKKAMNGCKIRILLAVPDSECVKQRNLEERNEGSIAERIKTSLIRLDVLQGVEGIEIRLHETPLYCSIYRFDAEMYVTPHLYGLRGSAAPLICFKKAPEGIFDKYESHFEAIWEQAIRHEKLKIVV